MWSQQLPRTDNQDYLGVTINTKLSWQPHINNMQNKASKTLGLLKRTMHAAPPQVRQTSYEVLVRPTLEFATCAWAPHTKTGIHTIECVQISEPYLPLARPTSSHSTYAVFHCGTNALTEEAVTASTTEVFQRAAIPVIQTLTL